MRKDVIAEWILSLAAPPERAASAVGDLLEEKRGPWRFWTAIARTTAAFLWRDAATDGLQSAGSAFTGWCFSVFVILALQLVFNFPRLLSDHNGLGWMVAIQRSLPRFWAEPPMGALLWLGAFYGGYARPGKELLTWVVQVAVWSLLCVITRVPTDQLYLVICWAPLTIWRTRRANRLRRIRNGSA